MGELRRDPQETLERTVSLHEGVVSRQQPWLLNENQAADLENMLVNKIGLIQRRGGTLAFGGRPELPGGLGTYHTPTRAQFFVSIWGNLAYKSQGDSGWAQVASAASMIPDLLHDFQPMRIGAQLGVAWCAVERITATDPSTVRSKLTVYNAFTDTVTQASLFPRCFATFQNRIWAGDGDTLHWSELGGPASYSTSNNLLVEPGLGGEITAILPTRSDTPALVVFKESLIAVLAPRWGSAGNLIPVAADALSTLNSSLRVINANVGCVATRSLASVPGTDEGDIFFLARDGVRSLQRSATDSVSGAGKPISDTIPDWISRINFTVAHRAAGTFFDNAYHLAVPFDGSASNTHILRYDTITKGWSLFRLGARDIRNADLGAAERFFLQHSARQGDSSVTNAVTDATLPHQVYQLFSGNLDPGAATIEWAVLSKAFALEDFSRQKKWNDFSMAIDAESTAVVELQTRVNLGAFETAATDTIPPGLGSVILGVTPLPWTGAGTTVRQRQYGLADVDPGYFLQMRLSSVTNSSSYGKISVYFQQLGGFIQQRKHESDS